MADVSSELQKLINANKFMDDEPPNPEKYKQSTYQRWIVQVSVHCMASVPHTIASGWSYASVYTCEATE